ncbi:MAG: DUF3500 domain-containing protein [Planctomycetota bacterium]|nr:MAG: DUF3500 domain-containing protein [Planctomycetota bacterium]
MSPEKKPCPVCDETSNVDDASDVSRRDFLRTAGTAATVAATVPALTMATPAQANEAVTTPETKVQQLYGSLSEEQKKLVCFPWDYQDPNRGLLRSHVAANWQITPKEINSNFYTGEQRALMQEIFHGIIQPEWHERYAKQMHDDNDGGGFGSSQAIAIFGTPGEDKFEFVITGRHMTLRCDGNTAEHVAFGGPIFYGHAAEDFYEDAQHTGNVFWSQAVEANNLYKMLDGRQQKLALMASGMPAEEAVAFRGGEAELPGISGSELSSDQKEHLAKVLDKLLEPYRQTDQEEARKCLGAQGGPDACSLVFYQEGDIGEDGVWDNWRLEGPSFVWHFRGSPHVHVWVNVADDPSVELNAS